MLFSKIKDLNYHELFENSVKEMFRNLISFIGPEFVKRVIFFIGLSTK